jgi:hypothetical protein
MCAYQCRLNQIKYFFLVINSILLIDFWLQNGIDLIHTFLNHVEMIFLKA